MMPRTWSWCAVSLLLAAVAGGSTLVEKKLGVTIHPNGTIRERTHLEVRLETPGDVDAWSTYAIALDENRVLKQASAYAVLPGGKEVKVKRKDKDVRESSGSSLHESQHFQLLKFRGLTVDSVLVIDHEVEVAPYHPSGEVFVTSYDPIERLEVTVTGGDAGWRWRLDGPREGLTVEETESGVTVTGTNLPKVDPPDLAPGGAAVRPVLRYAWGGEGSWEEVGAWYAGLLADLPRAAPPVRRQAQELIAGVDGPRQRLEALLAFMRQRVRYVAVEIGIGGYRPSPPEEVLARQWGDCKDKALLFVDFLAEAGIEAYPALILADEYRRLDRHFPAPQFNHIIVAVPVAGVAVAAEDPVGDGYLFVDPTGRHGTAHWLPPSDQDQDVLIVRSGSGTLARTPIRPQDEERRLIVDLTVSPQGDAQGKAALTLSGSLAIGFIAQISGAAPERTEEDVRSIFGALLPGVSVQRLGWEEREAGVPTVAMAAEVAIAGLVRGLDARPSCQLPGLRATPEPRLIADREVPMVLRPGSTEITWQITLPEGGCPPKAGEKRVENDVGLFLQAIDRLPDGRVTIDRKVEIRRRWIEPEQFPALREIVLAEHRARRRRIRLECE